MPELSMLWAVALVSISSVAGAVPGDSAFGAYSKNVAGIKEAARKYQPPPAPAVDSELVNHPVEAGSDVLARWRLNHGPVDMPSSAPADNVHQKANKPSSGGQISVAKDEAAVRSSLKNWRMQALHADLQSMTATMPAINATAMPQEPVPSQTDVESGSEALDQWSERKKFEAKAAAGKKKAAEDRERAAKAQEAAPPSSLFPTNEEVIPTKHVDIAKDIAEMHSAVHSSETDDIHEELSSMGGASGAKTDEIHKALSSMRNSSDAASQPALLTGSSLVNHKLDQKSVAQGSDVLEQWRLSHAIHKDDSKGDDDASSPRMEGRTTSKHKHHNTEAEAAAEMKATMDEWKHASEMEESHVAMHSRRANFNIAKDIADMHSAVHSSRTDEIHAELSSMGGSSDAKTEEIHKALSSMLNSSDAPSQSALLTGSASVNHKLDQSSVAQGSDVLEQWRLSHAIHKDDSKEDNDASSPPTEGRIISKHKHHNSPAEDAAEMKATMDEWKHSSKTKELHDAMHSMGANFKDDRSEADVVGPSTVDASEGASVLSDWKTSHRTLADDAVDLHTPLDDTQAEVPVVEKVALVKHEAKPRKEVPTVPPELLKAKAEDDVQGMNDAFQAFQRARMHENMQNIGEGAAELAKKVGSQTKKPASQEQVSDGGNGEEMLKKWQLHKKIEKMMPGVSSDTEGTSTSAAEDATAPVSRRHDVVHEDDDIARAISTKPKKRSLSSDAAAMHASMKQWATEQIHQKLQDMSTPSSVPSSETSVSAPPDATGPQVTQQHIFINATENANGADLLKQWTEQHKLEMAARNNAAANAAGEATVVQVGAQNGVADSDSDASPERKAADDVRSAMEAWTSKNVKKVHEQPSAIKFLKSKLNEIAHSDMTKKGEASALSVAHKKHSISDDLADMHTAVKDWKDSDIHQRMAGNLEDLTAAAKKAAEKALAKGQLSEKHEVNAAQSEEGASILDSYMQGHDPTEFREMEKAKKHTASLADPSKPSVKRVHRVPPGRFRWRGF